MGTAALVAPSSCRAEAARSWLRFLLGALEDALGEHHHSEPSQTPAGGTGWPSAHLGLLLLLSLHSTPAGCTAPSRSCPKSRAQPVPSRRTQAPQRGEQEQKALPGVPGSAPHVKLVQNLYVCVKSSLQTGEDLPGDPEPVCSKSLPPSQTKPAQSWHRHGAGCSLPRSLGFSPGSPPLPIFRALFPWSLFPRLHPHLTFGTATAPQHLLPPGALSAHRFSPREAHREHRTLLHPWHCSHHGEIRALHAPHLLLPGVSYSL